MIGKSIERYHILEQLGRGGMATVYKAFDTRLERDVAIKIIRREAFPAENYDRILKRFEREAKSMAKLSHPNIVKVHDYGKHEGAPYLVLEYLPGGNLKQYLGKPMPWQQAVQLLLPITRALAFAHDEGYIHRDVKPSNILIAKNGEPMLTDFGIAKLFAMDDTQTLTATGVGVGTPAYMAPEQGMGKEIDPRADIYALGIVLYELITGRKPFEADTPMATVFKHMSDPLPKPSRYVADIPEQAEKVLIKALSKQPENRYDDMGAFGQAITKLLTGQAIKPLADLVQQSEQPITEDADSTRDELIEKPVKQQRDDRLPEGKKIVWAKRSLIGIGVLVGIVALVIISSQVFGFKLTTATVMEAIENVTLEPTDTTKQESTPLAGAEADATQDITATTQQTLAVTKTPNIEWVEGDVLFKEDFEDGVKNGFKIMGGSWGVVLDDQGNHVLQTTEARENSWPYIEFGPTKFKNGIIQYRFQMKETDHYDNPANMIYLFFRVNGAWTDDSYTFQIQRNFPLEEINYVPSDSDHWPSLESKSRYINSNRWYIVKAEIVDWNFKIYLDGSLFMDAIDSQNRVESGRIGFQGSPNTTIWFDDIRVVELLPQLADSTLDTITSTPRLTETSVDALGGNWHGTITSIVYDEKGEIESSQQIDLTINSECVIGSVCGTFSIPDLPCSGNLTYTGYEEPFYHFVESDKEGEACVEGGIVNLQLISENSMRYSYHYQSAEFEITNDGFLEIR